MKVAELIDDLETGDRTMEHLKAVPAGSDLTMETLNEALNRLSSGTFIGSGVGLGLAAHTAQQQSLNQFINQQYSSANIQSAQSIQPRRGFFGGI